MAPEPFGLGAVLLAAGASRRLGQSKQLLEIDGEPLVVRQAKLLLEQEFTTVVVVTGAERERVEALLATLPVKCVFNPDWEQGMGRSLASGIQAMPERVRASLVLLCDQWKLRPDDLTQIVNHWAGNPQAAVVSSYKETSGPPAILPRALFGRLLKLKGDRGASKALRHWKGEIIELPSERAGVDIDKPEQLPS